MTKEEWKCVPISSTLISSMADALQRQLQKLVDDGFHIYEIKRMSETGIIIVAMKTSEAEEKLKVVGGRRSGSA